MGLFDGILSKILDFTRDTHLFNAGNTPEADPAGKLAVFSQWLFSARLGQPRSINVLELRDFAKSPWIQMVLNTIKKEVSTVDWVINNKDDNDETDNKAQIEEITEFFKNINSDHQTINDLASEIITDVGEVDSGAWNKVFTKDSYEDKDVEIIDNLGRVVDTKKMFMLKDFGKRDMFELRATDASVFLKDVDRWKRLKWYWQYSFKNPQHNPIAFEPDELVYFMMNPKTYSVYGFSPVQSIQQVLEVLIQSTRWNKDFFKNNAIPDMIIGLENANKESMQRFKNYWNKEAKGKPHKLLFHNTKISTSQFQLTNKDMEFIQGQQWYFHLVFAVFGVSPAEAGFHENVNRSTQEGQERITVKNAIKPYLTMIENAINKFVIPEFLQDENPKIKFEFKPIDHAQEQIEHDQAMQELDKKALTINEFRQKKGLEDVPWGDEPVSAPDPLDPGKDKADQEQEKDQKEDEKKLLPYNKAFEAYINGRDTVGNADSER